MITFENISLSYGAKVLYDGINFLIGERDRIALVGPNGAGKTTLFKILLGLEDYESGSVEMAKSVNVGYLQQENIVEHGRSLYNEVESIFTDILVLRSEIENAEAKLLLLDNNSDDYRKMLEDIGSWEHELENLGSSKIKSEIEKTLFGLGFSNDDLSKDTSAFSGGWQMRIAIAKLLLQNPSILLLDEPTNHLDILSQRWLENKLKNYEGALLVISHDQSFLDALCNRTFALRLGQLEIYEGNISFFEKESRARRELEKRQFENQQKKIQKTEAFIDRFRYKANKAKQVQSRIKALDKTERIEISNDEKEVHFHFPPASRSGQIIFNVQDLQKSFGELVLFQGLNLRIERGDCIAIVGPNGCGKSTLSKILALLEPYDKGDIGVGHNVEIAYFAQHQADVLNGKLDLVETLEEVPGMGKGMSIRSILGSFLFEGDEVFKKVGVLSGGEKSRLALAKILCKKSNCLILDEPTNHIDRATKKILQKAIQEYTGTTLIVSHDRHFLDPIINKVLELTKKGIRLFEGNISDYLQTIDEEEIREGAEVESVSVNNKIITSSKDRRRLRAEMQKEISPLRKKFKQLETEIESLENKSNDLEFQMADPDFFKGDPVEVARLVKLHQSMLEEIPKKYEEWENLSMSIGEMEKKLSLL